MRGDVDGAGDVHGATHDVEGSRADVCDEERCVATWTAPRMCAMPRTMRGRCRATCGTREMSAATWTVDGEPTAFGRQGYSVRTHLVEPGPSKPRRLVVSFDDLRSLRVVFKLNVEGISTR
jgi:hypothetical protein